MLTSVAPPRITLFGFSSSSNNHGPWWRSVIAPYAAGNSRCACSAVGLRTFLAPMMHSLVPRRFPPRRRAQVCEAWLPFTVHACSNAACDPARRNWHGACACNRQEAVGTHHATDARPIMTGLPCSNCNSQSDGAVPFSRHRHVQQAELCKLYSTGELAKIWSVASSQSLQFNLV